MQIHYYAIHGCDFLFHDGKLVITAPPGTADEALREYGFQQDNNLKWYKFLNEKECHAVMVGFPDNDVTFSDGNDSPQYTPCPEENSKAEIFNIPIILSIVFLILILSAIALPANFEWLDIWSVGLWIAGFLLIIFLRIRYPANPFGKILLIIYCILVLIIVIILTWVMIQTGILFLNFFTCNWSAC